ncbi:hypothetical protein HK097_000222 [Rhizophlyctis rosea]|uniref:Uncharacterized protein n=1 Tax=Rhizophlyctis rosea TaxID=64517 RepID=A0AAD5SDV7_9FUNG|nr:hypothetical protein HK097_000222 [Rhizophlyctis rosea]
MSVPAPADADAAQHPVHPPRIPVFNAPAQWIINQLRHHVPDGPIRDALVFFSGILLYMMEFFINIVLHVITFSKQIASRLGTLIATIFISLYHSIRSRMTTVITAILTHYHVARDEVRDLYDCILQYVHAFVLIIKTYLINAYVAPLHDVKAYAIRKFTEFVGLVGDAVGVLMECAGATVSRGKAMAGRFVSGVGEGFEWAAMEGGRKFGEFARSVADKILAVFGWVLRRLYDGGAVGLAGIKRMIGKYSHYVYVPMLVMMGVMIGAALVVCAFARVVGCEAD